MKMFQKTSTSSSIHTHQLIGKSRVIAHRNRLTKGERSVIESLALLIIILSVEASERWWSDNYRGKSRREREKKKETEEEVRRRTTKERGSIFGTRQPLK